MTTYNIKENEPITIAQLNSLERVIDQVFGRLNIDVEFSRHFLDRVNDERNKRQITLRELGELFAKEYKRWGNTIKHMPVDTQAVMKDLSSAINIPFVLNKDKQGKELVAKTVMRKKDFKSPDKTLPVESVKQGSQVKGNEPVPAKRKPTKGGETPHPMRGRLVGEQAVNEVLGGKVVKTVNGYPIHDMGEAYPYKDKRFLIRDPKIDVWADSAPTLRDAVATAKGLSPRDGLLRPTNLDHDLWRDEQKARLATGEVRRAVRSRRGFGESEGMAVDPKRFAAMKRREGWLVYVSFLSRDNFNLEFEKGDNAFEIVGNDDYWELFFGPNLSGRGKEFDNLEDAFQAAIQSRQAPTIESTRAKWNKFQGVSERKIVDPRESILRTALTFIDDRLKNNRQRQSLEGLAYDVAREIDLSGVATARDLVALYRQWQGNNAGLQTENIQPKK